MDTNWYNHPEHIV